MLNRTAVVIAVNLSRKQQARRRPECPGQTIDSSADRVVGRHSTMPALSYAVDEQFVEPMTRRLATLLAD
jgi:hypothetical protein